MTYAECYVLLRFFDALNPAFIEALAKKNKQTVTAYHHWLEERVYMVKNLTKEQKNFLLEKVADMDEEEISVMERVNHLPFRDVFELMRRER